MSFTHAVRRDLVVVAAGRGVSVVGDLVALMALTLWAAHRGSAALVVAALVVAASLPQLLLAPLSGLVVDRVPARRLIAGVSVLQALVTVALVPAVTASSVPAVVALVALLNAGAAVVTPAWQALLPSFVPTEGLPRALAVMQGTSAAAALLGPVLGGVLVGTGGTTAALLVDSATFAALAAGALLLRHDRRPERPAAVSRGELTAGVRVLLADPLLRALLVLVAVFVLSAGAVNVAEVFLVTRTLGAGPAAYGAVEAVFAAGLLLGSYLVRRDVPVATAARRVVRATIGMSLAIVALGLSPTVVAAGVASLAIGVFNAGLNVLSQSILVRRTHDAVRGRVFAALQAVVGAAMLVATGLGGVLLAVVDVRALLVGCGSAAALALAVAGRPLLAPDGPRAAPTDEHVLLPEGGART